MDTYAQNGEMTEQDRAALEQWCNLEAGAQAHTNFLSHIPGILDPTEHDCDLCGERYGGYDLLLHVHIVHKLEQSDICPCEDCILNKLTRSVDEDIDRRVGAEMSLTTVSPGVVETVRSFTPQPPQKTTSANEMSQTTAPPSAVEMARSFIPQPPQKPNRPSEMQNTASSSAVETVRPLTPQPPQKATPASEKAKSIRKSPSPQPNELLKVPKGINFHSEGNQIHEKNLSYEMSLIEMGELHKDASGVHWINKLDTAPEWLDGSDQAVKSRISGRPMS